MSAFGSRPGLLSYLSEPSASFAPSESRELRLRPLLAAHAMASVALGAAFVVVQHDGLVDAVRDAAPQADATVVTGSLVFLLLTVLPVIAVGGVLLSGVVFHAVVRAGGSARPLRWSLGATLGALLPVAFRNLLLAVAVLLGGTEVTERLVAIRYGDPFLLWAGLLVHFAARAGGGLSTTRSCLVAAFVIVLPVLAQVAFVA